MENKKQYREWMKQRAKAINGARAIISHLEILWECEVITPKNCTPADVGELAGVVDLLKGINQELCTAIDLDD